MNQDDSACADATVAWPKTDPAGSRPSWPPRRLGPVRLIRCTGKGGMGEVWLGQDEILARDVAVKLLSTKVASRDDPEAAGFLEGAKVASARAHPGLNRVLSADVLEGTPYLVLEYLDGPNLQELVARSGRLGLSQARAVIEAVGDAIAELHQHDLVHRDLKPSNIVLTRDGQIVVTDFGLACVRPASALRESVGAVAGTPAYMAPEMFEGVVSARTDVYAIGMTAYQLLCGRRLPDASDRTRCGWCQHELRGITLPICTECGHAIGDSRPDENGLAPPGLRWGFRARVLLLLHLVFLLAWTILAIVGGVIVSLLNRGAVMGPLLLLVPIFVAVALTLRSYEASARYALARSGRSWCRACKLELHDLQKPVCPDCGERI